MRLPTFIASATCLFFLVAAGADNANPALIERLAATRALNLSAILDRQFEERNQPGPSTVPNPYLAGRQETAQVSMVGADNAVCAVRFVNADRIEYLLDRFDSPVAAAASGYTITHYGRCGSCSTLSDLAVYLERPDLTTPARRCARKWGFDRVQRCLRKEVGFTEACAASWAYNALNTRKQCRGACIETYGLFNLLLHRYPVPNNRADGSLNACLQCDEEISGPGFRYSAGRTRRNSGIESAIQRPDQDVRAVDHTQYFDD